VKKLLLLGALLALVDPILAYLIYRSYGGWALLALLVLPPFFGGKLVRVLATRMERQAVETEGHGPGFGAVATLFVTHLLFWYPGPLTTLLGLLILFGPVRRGIHRWIFGRVEEAARRGAVSVAASSGGVVFTSGLGAGHGPLGQEPFGPLKRAEGRVIDPAGDLPEPKAGGE